MNIDLDKLDYITEQEKKLEKIIYTNREILKIEIKENLKQELTLYILAILSILYKEKHYTIYQMEKAKKMDQTTLIELSNIVNALNKLINELDKTIKENNLLSSIILISLNKEFITEALEMYFATKNTNYILEKMLMEKIEKRKKSHLNINPFIINQYLKYDLNKITEEEQIIADILEYDRLAQMKLDTVLTNIESAEFTKQRIKLVKKQILKNYDETKLNKVILFIINDTYQEIIEQKEDKIYSKIKSIVENKQLTNENLIRLFKQSESFSNIIIGKFIDYNFEIKEGRLDELKEKESYQYIKNRYKKDY